jgi:hypothetical protein
VASQIGLSIPLEGRSPRTWIALLHGRVCCSLAATSGVETAADVVKFLLAGADVVMTASALLRHGVEYAADLLTGLTDWITQKGFASVDEVRGLLLPYRARRTRRASNAPATSPRCKTRMPACTTRGGGIHFDSVGSVKSLPKRAPSHASAFHLLS